MKPGAQIIVKLNRGVPSGKPSTASLTVPETSSISEILVSQQNGKQESEPAAASPNSTDRKFASLSLGWAPHGGIELRNGFKIARVVPKNYLEGKTFAEQMEVMEKAIGKRTA